MYECRGISDGADGFTLAVDSLGVWHATAATMGAGDGKNRSRFLRTSLAEICNSDYLAE